VLYAFPQAIESPAARPELKELRRDLDEPIEKVENIIGYRKEIDHALEPIAAIEDHLGVKPRHA